MFNKNNIFIIAIITIGVSLCFLSLNKKSGPTQITPVPAIYDFHQPVHNTEYTSYQPDYNKEYAPKDMILSDEKDIYYSSPGHTSTSVYYSKTLDKVLVSYERPNSDEIVSIRDFENVAMVTVLKGWNDYTIVDINMDELYSFSHLTHKFTKLLNKDILGYKQLYIPYLELMPSDDGKETVLHAFVRASAKPYNKENNPIMEVNMRYIYNLLTNKSFFKHNEYDEILLKVEDNGLIFTKNWQYLGNDKLSYDIVQFIYHTERKDCDVSDILEAPRDCGAYKFLKTKIESLK
jgi:hypothetical protein